MTCGTIGRRGFEVCGSAVAGVALVTGRSEVLPFKHEGHPAVVKILPDRLNAIMATLARCPIGEDVLLHKDSVHLLVTAAADCWVEPRDICAMTIGTHENLAIPAALMRPQGIAGGIMRKITRLHIREGGGRAAMLRMTGAAGNRLILHHHGMGGGRVGQLVGNIRMTDQAAVGLGCGLPRCGMTLRAIIPYRGMRGHPADILSGCGI